jgi:hypothetical protein
MTLTAFQYVLWVAGFVAHASVVVVMIRRASYRRWPALFSLAIFEMSLTLTCLRCDIAYNGMAWDFEDGTGCRIDTEDCAPS